MSSIRIVSKHIINPIGTTQIRCIQPGEYFKSLGYDVKVERLYRSIPNPNEIIILHRVVFDKYTENFITYAKQIGCTLIYDTDDLLFEEEASAHLRKIGRNIHASQPVAYKRAMKACHAVTVSTPFLCDRVRVFHPRVYLMRNALSFDYFKKSKIIKTERNYVKSKLITIAYLSGSSSHDADFQIVQHDLLKLLKTNKNCRILLVGNLNFSDEFYRFSDRFEYKGIVHYAEYANIFKDIDINLIPLDVNVPFNHAKSELKYIEAGACGVPSIASPTTTMTEIIEDGVNGIFAGNYEWYTKLESLLSDSATRNKLGHNAYDHIRSQYSPAARIVDCSTLIKRITSECCTTFDTAQNSLPLSFLRGKLEMARAGRFFRVWCRNLVRQLGR